MVKLVNKKTAGFSLPEMILVMACLAVIISLSIGDVSKIFAKQIAEQEKITLQQIYKAMEVYSTREGVLPLDMTTCSVGSSLPGQWNVELSKYSELTPDRICLDAYGSPRDYKVLEIEQNFRNGTFKYKVQLASVTSYGPNFSDESDNWVGAGVAGYTGYKAEGDDMLVKYNNNQFRLEQYEETLNRIDVLEQYLERYARTKRAYARSLDIKDFDNYIMYPKDNRNLDPGKYFDSNSVDSSSNPNFTDDIAVKTLNETMSAVELAKILGLPEYYGRSALSGKPLSYISNPGYDRTKPCDNSKSNPPYYPPAIILTTDGQAPSGCI